MSARSGKVGVICIYVVNAALSLFHALTLLIGLELIMKGDRGRGNKETQASTSTSTSTSTITQQVTDDEPELEEDRSRR